MNIISEDNTLKKTEISMRSAVLMRDIKIPIEVNQVQYDYHSSALHSWKLKLKWSLMLYDFWITILVIDDEMNLRELCLTTDSIKRMILRYLWNNEWSFIEIYYYYYYIFKLKRSSKLLAYWKASVIYNIKYLLFIYF